MDGGPSVSVGKWTSLKRISKDECDITFERYQDFVLAFQQPNSFSLVWHLFCLLKKLQFGQQQRRQSLFSLSRKGTAKENSP